MEVRVWRGRYGEVGVEVRVWRGGGGGMERWGMERWV